MNIQTGYLAYPPALAEQLFKAQDTIPICPPVMSQKAALGALTSGASWVKVLCVSDLRMYNILELRSHALGARTSGARREVLLAPLLAPHGLTIVCVYIHVWIYVRGCVCVCECVCVCVCPPVRSQKAVFEAHLS